MFILACACNSRFRMNGILGDKKYTEIKIQFLHHVVNGRCRVLGETLRLLMITEFKAIKIGAFKNAMWAKQGK